MSGCNVLVMGVSGVGKTTVARRLAEAIGGQFVEGDSYHPEENIRSMRAGIPLSDAMRVRWLGALCDAVRARRAAGQGPVVVACSALKARYRAQLAAALAPHLTIHLTGRPEVIRQRLTERRDHFMPPALLQSQLADLEQPAPEEGTLIEIDIAGDVDAIVAQAISEYRRAVAHAGETKSGAP